MQNGGTEILPTSLLVPQAPMERAAGAGDKRKRDEKGRPRVRKDNLWVAHPKEQSEDPPSSLWHKSA